MIVDINFIKGNAKGFTEKEISDFKAMVLEAGQVKESTFDGLIRKNPTLMIIPDANEISAVGALKIPNDTHKNRVFEKSNSLENPEEFDFELGWIVSRIECKGYGKKIVEVLINIPNNIYATVRTENRRMKHILEKYGFKISGKSFPSDNDDYLIDLYIIKHEKPF